MFRKGKSNELLQWVTDRAAIKIASVISLLQNGFASFLSNKTKNYSKRTWKILIIVFSAVWGCISMYFFMNAFTKYPLDVKPGKIQFVTKPARNDSLEWMDEIYKQQNRKK